MPKKSPRELLTQVCVYVYISIYIYTYICMFNIDLCMYEKESAHDEEREKLIESAYARERVGEWDSACAQGKEMRR